MARSSSYAHLLHRFRSSSEPSLQSFSWSHCQCLLMHWPFRQRNLSLAHVVSATNTTLECYQIRLDAVFACVITPQNEVHCFRCNHAAHEVSQRVPCEAILLFGAVLNFDAAD